MYQGKPESGRDAINRYCGSSGPTAMSARPEYYSGRGVKEHDLGVPQLMAIYKGLVADFGEDAGQEFCRMMKDLTDYSATNFLNQFYLFFASSRVWQNTTRESGLDVGPDGPQRATVATVTMFEVMSRGNDSAFQRQASESLKHRFLQAVESGRRQQKT